MCVCVRACKRACDVFNMCVADLFCDCLSFLQAPPAEAEADRKLLMEWKQKRADALKGLADERCARVCVCVCVCVCV